MQKPGAISQEKYQLSAAKFTFRANRGAHASKVNGARPKVHQTPPAVNLLPLLAAADREREKREEAHKHQLNLLSWRLAAAHTRERNHNHYKQ